MSRTLAPITLLVIALAAVCWLWAHAPEPASAPTPVPTARVEPTAPLPAAEATLPLERLYRLAGVALGDPVSYAAVEAPDGSSNLYRQGAEIIGLGRLDEIHPDHVVITSENGRIELPLKPAPSPTAEHRRLGRAPKRTATPASELLPPADLDDTTDESDSADDPDLPAF